MGKPKKPDTETLLELILRSPGEELLPVPERMLEDTKAYEHFSRWFEELKRYLPDEPEEELRDYFEYALMGLVVGFSDRNLSPFLPQHTEIILPMLEDIRQVFRQIKQTASDYSQEDFIFRAYDYGIHKAYYLDWDLYMSHEMY